MALTDNCSTVTPVASRSAKVDVALFAFTLFVSAFLLFSIQPMFAKFVLPKLGGAPAVWSVAMVFFQSVLLAGYGYAHWLSAHQPVRRAVMIHLGVMAVAVFALPIGVAAGFGAPPATFTALWLIGLFAASVGLPFFAVSGNGPLLQAWFGRTGHPHGSDPYFLYGASNVGSFVALLSYPFLLEPLIGAGQQAELWTGGFLVLLVLIAACGVRVMDADRERTGFTLPSVAARPATMAVAAAKPSLAARGRWVALAFVPSALLVAVTAHLSTDVAAAPFLWVLPLALFLLTFVITFQRRPWLKHGWMLAMQAPIVCAMLLVTLGSLQMPMVVMVGLHLATFFVVAMACHGELVRQRPDAANLTEFYLWMSFGGVLGGIFAGLAAPVLFNSVLEYPLVLVLSLAIHPRLWRTGRAELLRSVAIAAGLALVAAVPVIGFGVRATSGPVIFWILGLALVWGAITLQREIPLRHMALTLAAMLAVELHLPADMGTRTVRSFFGVHKVSTSADGQFRVLIHGTTIHGAERIRNADGTPFAGRPEPSTYYWHGSPMAETINVARALRGGRLERMAVIGLGSGSIACHRRPGEQWSYYEIDPHVIELARDPATFRFLSECGADQPIVLGDARLTIADKPAGAYEHIIVDAFSSDAIPVHLLTREALATYFSKLDERGFVVFHISNRHMELSRVLAAIGREAGLVTYAMQRNPNDADAEQRMFAGSKVAVVARRTADLGTIATSGDWTRIEPLPGQRAWTDDFSNVLEPILRHYVDGDQPYRIVTAD